MKIDTVCFVGAGTMGCYNALVAAVGGYRAVLFDSSAPALEAVAQRQRGMAAMLVGAGHCTQSAVEDALSRVTTCSDLAIATREADLVSESVFERLDLKREIHRQLDAVCPPDAILTTNSSLLLVSQIEDVVDRGKRFAALHSHLGSPLVDIVAGSRTAPEVVALLEAYVRSIGGEPLVLRKEYPGYVLNAMLGPLLGTSLALVAQGLAAHEDLDRAWMLHTGAPMGPFGMMDLFGLNLINDSWTYVEGQTNKERLRPAILALLQPYLERGALGMAAGEGFYSYPEPAYQQPAFRKVLDGDEERYCSLAAMVVANALAVIVNGVVPAAQADRAWRVGMGVQKVPSSMLQDVGEQRLREILAAHVRADRCTGELATLALCNLEVLAQPGAGKTAP